MTRGKIWQSRQPVRGLSDAWITSKVKSTFALDPEVSIWAISVETNEGGIVTLRGTVSTSRIASKAVIDALDVTGVNAVETYLEF